jgi:hypothetical protein
MNINVLDQLRQLSEAGGFRIIDSLGGYVSAIVGLLLTVAAVATLALLVWGGIRWLTAGPDKGKLEEAKSTLTNAIIGLTIVAASWAAFLILNHFFGLGVAADSPSGGRTGTLASSGYCPCGNGLCTTSQRASRGSADGQCFRCDTASGSWVPISGDAGCRNVVISCQPCP